MGIFISRPPVSFTEKWNNTYRDDDCPICLVDYFDGVSVEKLPCGHVIHTLCCKEWWSTSPTCPVCRYTLT